MTFEEFLKDNSSKKERDELLDFISNERKNKHIMTFSEWKKSGRKDFLFLTYDLVNINGATNLYPPINNYIKNTLLFDRTINNRRLTNNSFVAFPKMLNSNILNTYGQKLNAFFTKYHPDFRIYLNITNDFYLHP